MKKLIINADDLGYSQRVNDLTFELVNKGRVSSATVLAGGIALDDAVQRLKAYPQCSFGVHLNLTELKPSTATELWQKYEILNEKGNFNGNIRRCRPTRELRRAIFKEWSRQIDLLFSMGVRISHIDSHHHVHTIPWLFLVLKRIQIKYGIRKVRRSRDLYHGSEKKPSRTLLLAKWCWNNALANIYETKVTSRFISSFDSFLRFTRESHSVPGTIEVAVHPGQNGFEAETALLSSNWKDSISQSFEMISYHQL